jgi:hypothetical protein
MTLGVAAVFPWPELVRSLPVNVRLAVEQIPSTRPSPGIVLAADSSWTWEKSDRFDDGAVKLFRLASHTIGIYAGDVVAGQRSIAQITDELRRQPGYDPTKLRRVVRESTFSVWRRYGAADSQLQMCIAFYHPSSGLVLWRLDDQNRFRPEEKAGIQTIGSDPGRIAFWEALKAEMERRARIPLTEQAFDYSWEGAAMMIAQAMREASDGLKDKYVGGRMLVGVVSATGAHARSYHALDYAKGATEFETLTLTDAEVSKFQSRNASEFRRRRGAAA